MTYENPQATDWEKTVTMLIGISHREWPSPCFSLRLLDCFTLNDLLGLQPRSQRGIGQREQWGQRVRCGKGAWLLGIEVCTWLLLFRRGEKEYQSSLLFFLDQCFLIYQQIILTDSDACSGTKGRSYILIFSLGAWQGVGWVGGQAKEEVFLCRYSTPLPHFKGWPRSCSAYYPIW